jgi:hypothetical protein
VVQGCAAAAAAAAAAELEKVRPELVALEEAFVAANPDVQVQRVPPPAAAKAKGFGSIAKR